MKKVFLVLIIALLSTAAFAHEKMNSKMDKMETKSKMKTTPAEKMEMKGGKMMVNRNGNTMEMKEPMTLTNGTVVMTNGSMKTKAGKMMQLKEGECVDKKVRVSKMKLEKKMDKMADKMDSKM